MTPKHKHFIIEYLKSGNEEKAYQAAYPNASGRSLVVGAERLLKKEDITLAITVARMRMRYEVEEEIKDIISNTLLSTKEKRTILAQIARGDLTVATINRHSLNRLDEYHREPTHRERMLAIKLDCEIASGRYDPNRIERQIRDLTDSLKSQQKRA